MIYTKLNKSEFVFFLNGRGKADFSRIGNFAELGLIPFEGEELLCVWDTEEQCAQRLPRAIVLREGKSKDFFAWSWTYLSGIRPLSAFVRVIERSRLSQLQNTLLPILYRSELAAAFACLPLAEAFLSGNFNRLEDLPIRSCSSTLSFASVRASIIFSDIPLNEILNRWAFAHRKELERGPVVEVMSVLKEVFSRGPVVPSFLSAFVTELQKDGRVTTELLREAQLPPQFLEAVASMKGDKEQRIRIVEEVAAKREIPHFFRGYIASLISPGSFTHLRFARDLFVGSEAREAFIWYCFLSGAYPESDVLSSGNALARRILRDLTQVECFLCPPRADISYEEFATIAPVTFNVEAFRRQSPAYIAIELLPGVLTTVRWLDTIESKQLSLPGSLDNELSKSSKEEAADISEAITLLQRAERLLTNRSSKQPRKPRRR